MAFIFFFRMAFKWFNSFISIGREDFSFQKDLPMKNTSLSLKNAGWMRSDSIKLLQMAAIPASLFVHEHVPDGSFSVSSG